MGHHRNHCHQDRKPKKGASYSDRRQAITKVREIMATQRSLPAGLRIGVVGGGCSGFQYSMAFENQGGMMDKVFAFDDLKVFVDATSLMYLNWVCRGLCGDAGGRRASSLRSAGEEHVRMCSSFNV